jgi:hypothetical protein
MPGMKVLRIENGAACSDRRSNNEGVIETEAVIASDCNC